MELFKFTYTTDATLLEKGEFINGAKSVQWTERYRDPGEFEIKAPLSSGLREFLPAGTLISHVDTYEVMIVENHEISEKGKEDPTLTITGRTFETFLEQRIVGVNLARSTVYVQEYIEPAASVCAQAADLINIHITGQTWDSGNDNLVNVVATEGYFGVGAAQEARNVPIGPVHDALMDILAIDDLGIRTIRRNTFIITGGSSTYTVLYIYKGVDKSASVIFSWKGGDLESAEYLFSIKGFKTSALVIGRYCWVVVDTAGYTKYNRRMMIVDGSDIDDYLDTKPDGAIFPAITQKMRVRGREALKSQTQLTISRTDISNLSKYRYRRDYNLGDLVSLDGNFGAIAIMRVMEYVEIEDENGESGHPTLAIPGA